jgi:predicted enzyme related to lactoylglutathione lyase
MHVVTKYPDGLFSWVDLATTDVVGAKAFYAGLFGWDAVDMPIDMGGFYTTLQIDGKSVAGLGQMQPDMQAQGVPSFWTAYVNHSDVDAVAGRAQAAGGTLLFPPMDVMQEGRMTMIQDPTGALFGVWQPRNHIGAQLVNMPNTLVWTELQTRDTDAAIAFYSAVFGWTHSIDGNGYVMFAQDGRIQAGMMRIDDSWGPVPSNWAIYFMVEDVEAAVSKVRELGGSVMVPPTQAGEMGRFAVVQDPQGGVFTVMQFSGPTDPPPGA